MSKKTAFMVVIKCALPKDGFYNWKGMSEKTKGLFDKEPIPCEGNGPAPKLCEGCRFCKLYEICELYEIEEE